MRQAISVTITTAAALLAAPVVPAAAHDPHTVERGETLSTIASDHGTTWQALDAANPQIGNPNLIYPGQRVTISGSTGASSPVERSGPSGGVWARVAQCESGGNWSINTGNGYYGGLQFSLASWRAVGGTGYPHHASPAEQIARAQRLLEIQGWATAWPACSAKLGLR